MGWVVRVGGSAWPLPCPCYALPRPARLRCAGGARVAGCWAGWAGGRWCSVVMFIRETAKSSKFCQPANFASRFLGKICCLFVDILKSRSSQYQQVLPTDSGVKFAAIDLFVATYINQETANSSIICQPVLGQNLLRLTCSWLYLNQETANGSNSANRFLAKFVAIDLFVDICIQNQEVTNSSTCCQPAVSAK